MQIAVIGLGKLGLPLACLHAQHHRVFGVDTNRDAVSLINQGALPFAEPGLDALLKDVVGKGFTAHTDYKVVSGADMSIVIVPTPSGPDGAFSSDYVLDAVEAIGKAKKHQIERHVVVVASTVMPGECDGVIRATLETASGKTVGEDIGLVYSPEFIALGSVIGDMRNPAMILVGASDDRSARVYADAARKIALNRAPVSTMSLTSAEIAKISLNAYVTMKISFANMLGEICEQYPDADASAVANAIGRDPRVGRQYIRPGGPYGGPCFPRDNRAFAQMGHRVGLSTPLARATDVINERQVDRILRFVADLPRQRVGIVGVSYKLGTPVTEEAFGVKLAEELVRRDYDVRVYNDTTIVNKTDVLPPPVKWTHDIAACFGDETTTILALPDPLVAERLVSILAHNERNNSILIDCWDVIPPGPWDDTHVIKIGKWFDAY